MKITWKVTLCSYGTKLFPSTEISLVDRRDLGRRENFGPIWTQHSRLAGKLSVYNFTKSCHSGKLYPVSGITFLHMNRTKLFDSSKCFLASWDNLCPYEQALSLLYEQYCKRLRGFTRLSWETAACLEKIFSAYLVKYFANKLCNFPKYRMLFQVRLKCLPSSSSSKFRLKGERSIIIHAWKLTRVGNTSWQQNKSILLPWNVCPETIATLHCKTVKVMNIVTFDTRWKANYF